MNRLFQIVAFICAPTLLHAETIKVRSGEHADFSRIVLQFDDLRKWAFGRVDGGYELRATDSNASFDTSQVFDFIPRDRISNVSSSKPGRLLISVACDCAGDAFEIREGRVVVDIKDGPPASNSPFETRLPEIDENLEEQPDDVGVPALADAQSDPATEQTSWPAFGSPLDVVSNQGSASGLDAYPLDRLPGLSDELSNETSEIFVTSSKSPDLLTTDPSTPVSTNRGHPDLAALVEIPLRPADDDGRLASHGSAHQPLSNNPNRTEEHWPDFPDLIASQSAVGNAPSQAGVLEAALLRQLSRAAAQGLVTLPEPNIGPAIPQPGTPETPKADLDNTQRADHQNTPATVPNFRMETATDRDHVLQQAQVLTEVGEVCIENSAFDFAAWGDPDPVDAPFDRLRTGIVGEFDQPDPDAILVLAQRLLFLGFGVETRSLLKNFPVDIPNADILLQLAEVVDNGHATPPGRLFDQLSCKTDAAMWAALAHSKIPTGANVDHEHVLRSFSALPIHLRRHVGPWLVERFLDIDDADTALSIRNIMDRAPVQLRSGFRLAEAQIASQSGDLSRQIEQLEIAVGSQGPHSATALAQLIETKLAQNLAVSEKAAVLASAMAVENRDSAIGRRLTRASIRAFALNGQIELTFQRIRNAERNGYITAAQASELALETHIRNAEIAPDAEFLLAFFRHSNMMISGTATANQARRLSAARLIELGFATEALALYSEFVGPHSSADKLVLASANLMLNETNLARSHLADEDGDDAKILTAKSHLLQGDHTRAAEIFLALGMEAEYQNAAWLAGNWGDVAQSDVPERAAIAELLATETVLRQKNENWAGENVSNSVTDGIEAPIANARELLVRSGKTRHAIENILAGS